MGAVVDRKFAGHGGALTKGGIDKHAAAVQFNE